MARPSRLGIALRLAGVAALGAATRDPRLAAIDDRARRVLLRSRRDDLDQLMPVVTDLGSVYALGGAAAVLVLGGARRLATRAAFAGGLAWVAAQGIKPLTKRTRPYQDGSADKLVRTPAGTSYPSGHPAVAMAMSRVLRDEVRAPARKLLDQIPDLVAFSRVYNGVHHPSDVLAGLWLGRAIGDAVRRRR